MARTLCILFKNNDYKGHESTRLYNIPREYFVCKIINRDSGDIGGVEENCTVLCSISLKEEDEFNKRALEVTLDVFFVGMTVEGTCATG